MFLNRLRDEQKKAFLAIAIKLVGADGRLDPRERVIIETIRYEMGLFSETDLPGGDMERIARVFDTHDSRVIVLMEAIAIALADEDLAKEEENLLRELARIFDFTEEKATAIEAWVIKFRDTQKEAEALIKG